MKNLCDRCKKETDKIYPTFGKVICFDCKENRPKKGSGNSGMKDSPHGFFVFEDGIILEKVPKSDGIFGNLFFSHYPESKGIVGRSLCYLIYVDMELFGIIGCSSPPINYKIFKEFFNNCDEKNFVNNNVFRLIKSKKNIGTQILKKFRNRIREDYKIKYGDELIGIVTFVEKPRTGALYKADNWSFLGETQGKRMRRDPLSWEKIFTSGEEKYIYGYKY